MRRFAAALVLGCLLVGCGRAVPTNAPPLPFATAALPSYVATYRIEGVSTGTQSWSVSNRGTETTIRIQEAMGSSTQDETVVLKRDGLGLVSAQATASGTPSVAISAQVQGEDIVEKATLNGIPEAKSFALRGQTLVNVALLPTLAGLDVAPGEQESITDVILENAMASTLQLTTGKPLRLTTSAGSFSCIPISLSGSAGRQTAFVAPKQHLLVRYEDGTTVVILTKVTPA